MPSDTPAVRPALSPQPIVTQDLGVEIIDFETAVMRIRNLGSCRGPDEEGLEEDGTSKYFL